jgi:hypothetical protein
MQTRDKADQVFVEGLKQKVDGFDAKSRVVSSDMVPMQWTQRRFWYSFSLLLSLVATAAAFTERASVRGHARRWPRLEVVWAS